MVHNACTGVSLMSVRSRASLGRTRVGKVSVYPHHGAWWMYYREGGRPVRKNAADLPAAAVQIAAQVNAQLATGAPTPAPSTGVGRTIGSSADSWPGHLHHRL